MKTLVLGLGNPLLTDDGVGPQAAAAVRERLGPNAAVEVVETSLSGLNLLDLLVGYDRLVVVDAIQTKGGQVGDIHQLTRGDFASPRCVPSWHRIDLFTAIDLGKALGLPMPQEVKILAVEVADVTTFAEECTPQVRDAVPVVVGMVLRELATPPGGGQGSRSRRRTALPADGAKVNQV